MCVNQFATFQSVVCLYMLDGPLECNGGTRPNWSGRLHSCGTAPNYGVHTYKTSWREPLYNIFFTTVERHVNWSVFGFPLGACPIIIHDILRYINVIAKRFVTLNDRRPETLPFFAIEPPPGDPLKPILAT